MPKPQKPFQRLLSKIHIFNKFLKIVSTVFQQKILFTCKRVYSSEKELISLETDSRKNLGFVKKDNSYVIIGSATNLWVKTVNWLLQQDAKKLIFIISGTNSVIRRSQTTIYSLIQKYCDVSFVMTSAERLNTVKEGESLLQEFASFSKIDAIFCVEMVC